MMRLLVAVSVGLITEILATIVQGHPTLPVRQASVPPCEAWSYLIGTDCSNLHGWLSVCCVEDDPDNNDMVVCNVVTHKIQTSTCGKGLACYPQTNYPWGAWCASYTK